MTVDLSNKRYFSYIILLILGSMVLLRSFGGLLVHPNSHLFVVGDDALKNYYTPAYYVKYDEGLRFSGMNYPYGEHIVFTDNQPVLSLALNFIDDHIYPIASRVPAVLNLLMIGSILLCMVLVFRLLKHYGLPSWYAIPAAVLIATLSPQIHRIEGHYALAYACFVPLIWNLLLETISGNRKWIAYALLLFTITFFGFLHAYYLLMGAVFALAYLSVSAFMGPKDRRWLTLGMAFLAALIPIVIFQGFLAATDSVADRPNDPYGFFLYRAYLSGIFLPVEGPLWDAWNRLLQHVKRPEGEAFAYTGLVCAVVFVFTLVRWGKNIFRMQWKRLLLPSLPGDLQIAFWSAVLVLLFAMAFPFTLGLEFLLEILTPLKQFRSLGRFAWVFYYVFCVYAVYYLYLLFRRMRQRGLGSFAWGMLAIAFVVWGAESALFLQTKTKRIKEGDHQNVFQERPDDYGKWLSDSGRSLDEFQAILPIPAFFLGSEKFIPQFFNRTSVRESFKASYDTGLPLACGMMSRTSLSQSLQTIQVLSNSLIPKTVFSEYPSDKPLLMLVVDEVPLTHHEQALVPRGRLIASRNGISLYELRQLDVFDDGKGLITSFEAERDSMYQQEGLFSREPAWTYFDGFDAGNVSSFGAESLKANTKIDTLPLFEGAIPVSRRMRASLWVKADVRASDFPILHYKEFDVSGKEIIHQEINPKFFANISGDWVEAYHVFTPVSPDNRMEMYIAGKYPEVESFLIRPDEIDVYMPTPDGLMWNNIYVED